MSYLNSELFVSNTLEEQFKSVPESALYYGVTVCSMGILLPRDRLCEVVANPAIAPMPNSPDFFIGLMTVRGDLVPVYSLATFLSSPCASRHMPTYVIVFGQGELRVAICCDTPPQILGGTTFTAVNNIASLPDSLKPLLGDSYFHAGGHWFDLDVEKLFAYLSDSFFCANFSRGKVHAEY